MNGDNRDRNIVATICYVPILSVVISLVILFVEKEDRFIRFHAMQAFIFSMVYFASVFVLGSFPYVGSLLSGLLFLIACIVWFYGMMSAYKGQILKLPLIGDFVENRVS